MVRKIVLGCGIASSMLYVASDILVSWWDPNYSYRDQSFSELLAPGSPTRPLLLVLNAIPYGVLVTAFGVGVWASAGRRRAGPITGALLVGYAVIGTVGGVFFSAPTREVLEAGKETWRNTLHLPATAVMILCILLSHGLRVDATRQAVPVLLVRDDPRHPRVWRLDGLTGRPGCR
jgi:Protein of unknown function (DUF998)